MYREMIDQKGGDSLLKSLKRSESEHAALPFGRGIIAKESEMCRVWKRTPTFRDSGLS
jgi:hypothetical protein